MAGLLRCQPGTGAGIVEKFGVGADAAARQCLPYISPLASGVGLRRRFLQALGQPEHAAWHRVALGGLVFGQRGDAVPQREPHVGHHHKGRGGIAAGRKAGRFLQIFIERDEAQMRKQFCFDRLVLRRFGLLEQAARAAPRVAPGPAGRAVLAQVA